MDLVQSTATNRRWTDKELVEYLEAGEQFVAAREIEEDVAAFWWAQIASDVALGRRALPDFIRDRLDNAALFSCLDERESFHFEQILNELSREEIAAARERTRERA